MLKINPVFWGENNCQNCQNCQIFDFSSTGQIHFCAVVNHSWFILLYWFSGCYDVYSCRFWAASTVTGPPRCKRIVHVCALRFFCRKCGQNPRKMVCFGVKMSKKCQLSPQKNEMMVVAFCGDNGVYARWIMVRFSGRMLLLLTSFMA